MEPTLFCNYCSKICFPALRGPSESNIADILNGVSTGTILASPGTEVAVEKVLLGTLERIRRDSSRCQLCSLFCHIVARQGAVFHFDRTLDDENIVFWADPDLSYYAKITDSAKDNRTWFIMRRLSLTAHIKDDPEQSIAYFDHVLQACDVGLTLSKSGEFVFENLCGGTNRMLFGGRKRPMVVDISWLQNWIQICEERHGLSCSSTEHSVRSSEPVYIRLIDIKQKCIKKFGNLKSDGIKFAALSYVWGSSAIFQPVKLEIGNTEHLQTPGSLIELSLPQTITDALELASLLELEYLWVDALCIIQDSLEDQKCQIGQMANIYSSAFLTIVAAFGDHSNAGLPGLRPGTRSYKQREIVVIPPSDHTRGLSLITTVKSNPRHWDEFYSRGLEDIDFSKWNSRAWTMQERALSRRNIIFTKEQVLWSCQGAYFCEESRYEVPRTRLRHFDSQAAHQLGIGDLSKRSTSAFWGQYTYLVERYTRRDMTYDGDVYDAFQAITDGLQSTSKERFLWGLPCSRFDLALSWDTFHGLRRRTALSKLPMTVLNKRVKFPSWSWMGWIGPAHCWVGDDRLEDERPEVICYIHRSYPLQFLPVRAMEGVEGALQNIEVDSTVRVSQSDVEEQLCLTESTLINFPDGHVLFFWTYSAFFKVEPPTLLATNKSFSEYGKDRRPIIRDTSGAPVGSVCKMQNEYWALDNDIGSVKEFIIVGRRDIMGIPNYPQVILALQVDRVDAVSRRVNIAEISDEAWLRANPRRKLVALT